MGEIGRQIEKFKAKNGNVTYTIKELVGAIHTRLDELPCATQGNTIAANKAAIKMLIWVLGALTTVDIMLITLIISIV